ncbi:MAG: hypothetical protein WAV76_12465, partial [Bacteroidota bacterium]
YSTEEINAVHQRLFEQSANALAQTTTTKNVTAALKNSLLIIGTKIFLSLRDNSNKENDIIKSIAI